MFKLVLLFAFVALAASQFPGSHFDVKVDAEGVSRAASFETKAPGKQFSTPFLAKLTKFHNSKRLTRQAIDFQKDKQKKWPNGIVPFEISDEFDDNFRQEIRKSIVKWNEDVECVKWIPRTDEQSYVNFSSGAGCRGDIGRDRRLRPQPITLGKGCDKVRIILHEMGHAIGFGHEHNRSDRDKYIKVLLENIPKGDQKEYQMLNPRSYINVFSYDYYSLMHYGMYTYKHGLPNYEILQPGIDESRVGASEGFTPEDLKKISHVYC